VQVEPIKPLSKAPGNKRFKLKCEELLSNFAFKFELRYIEVVEGRRGDAAAGGRGLHSSTF
jgi:hypothetical protein